MNCTGNNCTTNDSASSSQIGFYVSIIAIGLTGVCVNSLTIAVILSSKKMNGPCFKLVAGCSLGSLLFGLTTAVVNIGRVGEYMGLWSLANRYRGTCALTNFYVVGHVAIPFISLTMVLIAIDRLLATLVPTRYRLFDKKKYTTIGLSVCGLLATVDGVAFLFAEGPLFEVVSTCSKMTTTRGVIAYNASISINVTLNTLCVVCYLAMFGSSYVQIWRMKRKVHGGFATESEQQQFLKQQAVIMPAAKMLAILYGATQVVPLLADHFVTPGGMAYFTVSQFKSCAIFVEFISLIWRCKVFRDAVMRLFRGRGNTVVPNLAANSSQRTGGCPRNVH